MRNRPIRRRLVVASLALLALETALLLASNVVEPGAALVGVLLGLVAVILAFVVLLGMLKASTRGVEELSTAVVVVSFHCVLVLPTLVAA